MRKLSPKVLACGETYLTNISNFLPKDSEECNICPISPFVGILFTRKKRYFWKKTTNNVFVYLDYPVAPQPPYAARQWPEAAPRSHYGTPICSEAGCKNIPNPREPQLHQEGQKDQREKQEQEEEKMRAVSD